MHSFDNLAAEELAEDQMIAGRFVGEALGGGKTEAAKPKEVAAPPSSYTSNYSVRRLASLQI